MSKRNLDNYVPVNVRVMQARAKYGDDLGILTEVRIVTTPELAYAYIIAAIVVGNRKLANGHAMTTELNDEKAIEKAESSAVGRALAFAGFSADTAIASAEDMKGVDLEDNTTTVSSTGQTGGITASKVTTGPLANRFTKRAAAPVVDPAIAYAEAVANSLEVEKDEGNYDIEGNDLEAAPVPVAKPVAARPNVLAKFKKPNVPPSLAGKVGGR